MFLYFSCKNTVNIPPLLIQICCQVLVRNVLLKTMCFLILSLKHSRVYVSLYHQRQIYDVGFVEHEKNASFGTKLLTNLRSI